MGWGEGKIFTGRICLVDPCNGVKWCTMLYLVTEKGPIFIVNVGDHLTLYRILVSAQRKNSTSKKNKQKLVREGGVKLWVNERDVRKEVR